ncbi:MAG: response regulator [Candidatus Omnitrophica bacterium]|nr:response regulator [Candidatus Omnitrophota bacterium]
MFRKFFEALFPSQKQLDTNKLILVVDDGEVERKFMQNTLAQRGYRVLVASSGEDAVKLAHENKPDLIFLDYSMPGGMNGHEACKLIKRNETTKDTQIVFLSGSVTPTKVIDCYDAGAEYFLAKPISASTLLEHTRLLIEDDEINRKQAAQQQQQ